MKNLLRSILVRSFTMGFLLWVQTPEANAVNGLTRGVGPARISGTQQTSSTLPSIPTQPVKVSADRYVGDLFQERIQSTVGQTYGTCYVEGPVNVQPFLYSCINTRFVHHLPSEQYLRDVCSFAHGMNFVSYVLDRVEVVRVTPYARCSGGRVHLDCIGELELSGNIHCRE